MKYQPLFLKLTENDLTFSMYIDLFRNKKTYNYSIFYDGFYAERREEGRDLKTTRVYNKNFVFKCDAKSYKSWWLWFFENPESCIFQIDKQNEKISCFYYENNQEIKKVSYPKQEIITTYSNSYPNTNDYTQKATEIYKKLIANNETLFNQIVDKDNFANQLTSLLTWDLEDNNEDHLDYHLKNIRNFIQDFIFSEKDCIVLKNILTFDYFVGHYENLKKISIDNNLKEIIKEEIADFEIAPSLFYSREEIETELYNSIVSAIRKYNHQVLLKKYDENYIKQVYGDKISNFLDEECFFEIIKRNILVNVLTNKSDQEIENLINDFVNDFSKKDLLYKKFISLYGVPEASLIVTSEKKQLYQQYESGKINLDQSMLTDYMLYKKIIIEYEHFAFVKNSNRLKPSLAKLPKHINYLKQIIGLLIDCDILSCNNMAYCYKSFDNIDKFVNILNQNNT